jgi:HEPN domain-containing protein
MKPKAQNWIELSDEDEEVAGHLYFKKKYLHCLFFCQQAVEKALKAVYYEKYSRTPPRKHDLIVLAEAADIFSELDDPKKDLFVLLSQYYIESRYAEDLEKIKKHCTQEVTEGILKRTGDALIWLKSKLK